MAWTAKTQIATTLAVAGTELFSSAVQLEEGETAHIQVEADFPGTPTDDLLVRVYATLDDSSENWDDSPIYEFSIDNGTDPHAISFELVGVYKFRLGFIRDGSTDTITTNAWYRQRSASL